MFHEKERGMRRYRIEEYPPSTSATIAPIHNYIEYDRLVDKVGKNAREGDQASSFGIAIAEDEVGVLDHAADVFETSDTAPCFALENAAEVFQVLAGEAADEVEAGFDRCGRDIRRTSTAVELRAGGELARNRHSKS